MKKNGAFYNAEWSVQCYGKIVVRRPFKFDQHCLARISG